VKEGGKPLVKSKLRTSCLFIAGREYESFPLFFGGAVLPARGNYFQQSLSIIVSLPYGKDSNFFELADVSVAFGMS
jgi:hypothetical protein